MPPSMTRCPRCGGQVLPGWSVDRAGVVRARSCLMCGFDPDAPPRAPTAEEAARAGGRGEAWHLTDARGAA